MITIDFTWSVFLFISAPLLLIFLIWLIPFKKRAVFNKLSIEKESWNCAVCTYTYFIFQSGVLIAECPRCGSLNKREEALGT